MRVARVTSVSRVARLTVWVQPRASRTEVAGWHGDALKIRLAAPPVDEAANRELVRFVAERCGISRQAIRLVAGQSARRKTVRIEGIDQSAAEARLLGGGLT